MASKTEHDVVHSGTGAGLDAFIEWVGRTGEMNSKTAQAWRTSAKSVLSIDDDWAETDVTSLNIDNTLSRFEMLNRTQYSHASMVTYRTRFRQAIELYRTFLESPSTWRSAIPSTRRVVRKKSSSSSGSSTTSSSDEKRARAEQDAPSGLRHADVRLIGYDLPLRPDLVIRLSLPIDLTASDAERVAAFVRSLAFVSASDAEAPTGPKD